MYYLCNGLEFHVSSKENDYMKVYSKSKYMNRGIIV